MPPWVALTLAEARRARRLAALSRRHPAVPLASALAAAGGAWLLVREGITIGRLIANAAPALVTVNAAVTIAGVLVGGFSSLFAPRSAEYDEQLRLLPLRPAEVFIGTTGLPLLVAWLLSAMPLVLLFGPMYWLIPVPERAVWPGLLLLSYIAACAGGAGIADALRHLWYERRVGRRTVGDGAIVVPFAYAAATSSWLRRPWWVLFGGALPASSDAHEFAVLAVGPAAIVVATGAALALLAWVRNGEVQVRARHARTIRWDLSSRCTGRYRLMSWWVVAAVIRDARLWLTAAVIVPCVVALVAIDHFRAGVPLFSPFAPLVALTGGAQIAMSLSEPLRASAWFWRLVPARRFGPGLWWWAGAAGAAAAVSGPALVILAATGQVGWLWALAGLASSGFGAAAVGRAAPWNSRSQGQQFVTMTLYFGALFAAMAAFDWLAGRSTHAFASLVVVLSSGAISALACAALPWQTSWRPS